MMGIVNQRSLQLNSDEAPSLRGVSSLKLSYFRSYESLTLEISPQPVVLTGRNGAGKTNILEALSFLVPGRGLRRARLADVRRIDSNKPWAVSTILQDSHMTVTLGTGLDPDCGVDGDKRVSLVEGQRLKNQNDLSSYVSMTWLTPQMDRLFLDGASARRRFLDRVVYGFDTAHATRLNRYEHRLRERSQLLKRGGDPQWLSSLETSLAEEAISITAARQQVVGHLNQAMTHSCSVFPRAILSLSGQVEDRLVHHSALDVEDWLRDTFKQSRGQDALTGGAQVGAHRSDLDVLYAAKNMWAPVCSTGEQKALLLSIVLAAARLQSLRKEAIPILLLDEVIAHLDKIRRTALFDELISLKIQTWLTGTDEGLFEGLQAAAHFVKIRDAKVVSLR